MGQIKRDKRIIIPLSQAELDAIDDWRFAKRMPSRADTIRRLIAWALEHDGPLSGQLADYAMRAYSQIEQGVSVENTELDSSIDKALEQEAKK